MTRSVSNFILANSPKAGLAVVSSPKACKLGKAKGAKRPAYAPVRG